MLRILLALAITFFAAPALAIIGPRWPAPIEEAPVERAIANVEADRELTEAQRERLLGRLHLIGYAQGNVQMQRYPTGEWALRGGIPCDPAYRARPENRLGFPCGQAGAGPPRELPRKTETANSAARAHLRAARVHYERALSLDGTVLRARLGFAYVLDQLNEDEGARRELRDLITLGLPRLQNAWSEWEDYAIMSEAVVHLGGLARSDADSGLIAQARVRLGATQPEHYVTPIVVPLADAPFERLIDADSLVAFDFAGTGERVARGWLGADAAWLVWDPEGHGDIRTGFQLIGQRAWGVFWTDGFEALHALDDNRDGELTGRELDGLALWRDADGDGVSERGEVRKLAAHGIVGLTTQGTRKRRGLIVAPAGVRLQSGERRPLYDWTPDGGRALVAAATQCCASP